MSKDVIGGIAVIRRSPHWDTPHPLFRIGLMLYPAAGRPRTSALMFSEGPPPAGIEIICGQPVWEFTRDITHGWIACKPSVRVMDRPDHDIFHNEGNWRVQYVEMIKPEPPVIQHVDDPSPMSAHDVLLSLNDASLSFDARAALFEHLRQTGVIY